MPTHGLRRSSWTLVRCIIIYLAFFALSRYPRANLSITPKTDYAQVNNLIEVYESEEEHELLDVMSIGVRFPQW